MLWSMTALANSPLVGNLRYSVRSPTPARLSDDVHGRVRSEFGVDLARGAQDAFGVARGVGAQRSVLYRCHLATVTDS